MNWIRQKHSKLKVLWEKLVLPSEVLCQQWVTVKHLLRLPIASRDILDMTCILPLVANQWSSKLKRNLRRSKKKIELAMVEVIKVFRSRDSINKFRHLPQVRSTLKVVPLNGESLKRKRRRKLRSKQLILECSKGSLKRKDWMRLIQMTRIISNSKLKQKKKK